ncbi:hypothetical protein L9F63_015283, partial [Diploptera punctata]
TRKLDALLHTSADITCDSLESTTGKQQLKLEVTNKSAVHAATQDEPKREDCRSILRRRKHCAGAHGTDTLADIGGIELSQVFFPRESGEITNVVGSFLLYSHWRIHGTSVLPSGEQNIISIIYLTCQIKVLFTTIQGGAKKDLCPHTPSEMSIISDQNGVSFVNITVLANDQSFYLQFIGSRLRHSSTNKTNRCKTVNMPKFCQIKKCVIGLSLSSSQPRTRGFDSGGLVAMATAQPAFNMASGATTATTGSASDLVGGGSSGGGGSQQGQQQGVSSTATVTVVTSPPNQQQQQAQANSVSITAVTHPSLQQNGSVDGSLDSPSDSSNGGGTSNGSNAQVTAQVVVSSDTASVTAGNSEQNGSASGNQTATATTAIVGSPHYITVTGCKMEL